MPPMRLVLLQSVVVLLFAVVVAAPQAEGADRTAKLGPSLKPSAALRQQELSRAFVQPPDVMHGLRKAAAPEADCPQTPVTVDGQNVSVDLQIAYSDHTLLNPDTGTNDQVRLRTYNGCLTGPLLSVSPGDQLTVTMENQLPADDPADCPETMNTPSCFNVNNLHLHGMHVSPAKNGDNVFVAINPGAAFTYSYKIRPDHPAGTFWFHSHHHGSTAISVSSGMEGVLIVRGARAFADRVANHGVVDIDTVLKDSAGQPFPERVMLFQQIPYGCFSDAQFQNLETDSTTGAWLCNAGETGVVENFPKQFGVDPAHDFESAWVVSGRYTAINGKVQPILTATTGVVERWRLVHGGERDTIDLKIVKAQQVQDSGDGLAAGRLTAQAVNNACTGATVAQYEIAADGITRAAVSSKQVNILDPGQRSDALVVFPSAGLYCVLDEAAPAENTIIPPVRRNGVKGRQLLALVRVSGGTKVPGTAAWLGSQLAQANADLPSWVAKRLSSLDLTDFTPPRLKDLSTATVTGHPTAFFELLPPQTVDNSPTPGQPAQNPALASFLGLVQNTAVQSDPQPYVHTAYYTATRGTVDEWKLGVYAGSSSAILVPHVFHIHVNPFQIIDITDTTTEQSIFDPAGGCTTAEASAVPMYCDQKGVYRDTLFLQPGYVVTARTRYEDFTGEYVLHCHILDHEDQGMMMNVKIVPAGQGASSSSGSPSMAGMVMH